MVDNLTYEKGFQRMNEFVHNVERFGWVHLRGIRTWQGESSMDANFEALLLNRDMVDRRETLSFAVKGCVGTLGAERKNADGTFVEGLLDAISEFQIAGPVGDANPNIGGVYVSGVPSYRLKQDFLPVFECPYDVTSFERKDGFVYSIKLFSGDPLNKDFLMDRLSLHLRSSLISY